MISDGESSDIAKKSDRVKLVLKWLEGGESILDIGANTCWMLEQCEHPRKVAIDIARKFIKTCIDKGFESYRAYSWKLPFDDNSFDRILFGQTLAHMRKDQGIKTLTEIKRVLKPEGRAVISTKVGPIFRSAIMFNKTGKLLVYVMSDIHVHEWEPPEIVNELINLGFIPIDGIIISSSTEHDDHFSIVLSVTKS